MRPEDNSLPRSVHATQALRFNQLWKRYNAFFFSIETLATVGYGTMAPATLYGHSLSAIEIVCGMVFTAIMTGLLFVRFSKPRPKILFADQAVVTTMIAHRP